MKTRVLQSATFFPENRTVYEMSKNVVDTEGPEMTSEHGAYALHAGLARPYARMRVHTPMRPGNDMHARRHEHAHTDQCVILLAFLQQQWFHKRDSMLR
jgi:hypothetical protein